MKAYWHRERRGPNFGDMLTPWLLPKYGIPVRWAQAGEADFFGAGSIAARIPAGFSGWVWGTGKLKADQQINLTAARVLAVRGPLTHEADLYADPGLLAGLYAPAEEKRWPVGVISHYIEDLPHKGKRISILSAPEEIIRAAVRCERIVTSSLHALILADSLGILNMWVYSSKVIGEGFKFRDYAASYGQTIEPDVWRLAPQEQVAEKQAALISALDKEKL